MYSQDDGYAKQEVVEWPRAQVMLQVMIGRGSDYPQ